MVWDTFATMRRRESSFNKTKATCNRCSKLFTCSLTHNQMMWSTNRASRNLTLLSAMRSYDKPLAQISLKNVKETSHLAFKLSTSIKIKSFTLRPSRRFLKSAKFKNKSTKKTMAKGSTSMALLQIYLASSLQTMAASRPISRRALRKISSWMRKSITKCLHTSLLWLISGRTLTNSSPWKNARATQLLLARYATDLAKKKLRRMRS